MSKVAILVSAVVVLLLGGGKIEWSKLTLEEGLAESKKTGKPLFAYFTSGRTFCKQQDEGAFSDDEVVARTRQFICVKVDCAEPQVLTQYKKQYKFLGTPTVLILDGEGRGLATFDGLTSAAEFIKKLDEILAKGGVVPSSGLPQDARAKEILARIEKELAESHKRLQYDVEQIVRGELEKAGVAKTTQPQPPVEPPKPTPQVDLEKEVDAMLPRLSDQGITGRLKKLLRTKEGKDCVRQALEDSGAESVNDLIEMYFDKAKDGTLTLKEEFTEQLEELLDQVDPGEEPPKKEEPKGTPKEDRKPAYLGIQPETLTDGERAELGIEPPYGFRLYEVKKGSPAEAAGLKPGDILLTIGGTSVSEETMGDQIAAYRAGDTVEVTILREKKKLTKKVIFTARP